MKAKGAATVIVTFPVKPFKLVTVIVVEFAPPRAMFMNDGFAVRVKPVPANTVFFSSRRRHTRSVSAFLLNRSSDLLKFMRASIKMIGVSNLQSFIASMTQKLTLSDISDESKNYLDKAGITTACLRIKSKWTAGGK